MNISPSKKGIFLTIGSYACYAIASFIVKLVSASQFSMVFSRNLIGLLIFSPLFIWKRKELKTKKLIPHILRTSLSLMAMYCSVYGISYLNLGDAILLEQTAPFFVMIILFLWKKEKISLFNFISMLISFTGVVLIIVPQFAIFQIYSLASLASGLLAGLCFIIVETLVKTESPVATLFYLLLVSTLVSAVPAFPQLKELDFFFYWPFLLLIGFFFALCQMLRNVALTFVNSNVLASYSYLCPLFSIVLGLIFLDEPLTQNRIIGSIMILGSGVYVYLEKLNKEKTKNPAQKNQKLDEIQVRRQSLISIQSEESV